MTRRSYEGPDLDGTVQYISEAPVWSADGETVDAPGDDTRDAGTEAIENVPSPDDDRSPETTYGQNSLDEFGWSP